MLYDTHCHPYLAEKKSQEYIIENFFSKWWVYINSVSVDLESSKNNITLAQKNSWIFAVIWIHPTHTLEYKDSIESIMQELEELYHTNFQFIVAIWETGLDYYWLENLSERYSLQKEEIISLQKIFFREHIRLAKKYNLPLVIHNRNASEDVYKILVEEDYKNFVFHCYSEDLEYAQKLIKFAPDCCLWFWWVLTFKNAESVQNTAKNIPLKNIILETDSPYLTPIPFRGKEENEPLFSKYILDKLCELRDESFEIIQETVFSNSLQCFWIKKYI